MGSWGEEQGFMRMMLDIMSGRNGTYSTWALVGNIVINEGRIAESTFGAKWWAKGARCRASHDAMAEIYQRLEVIAQRSSQGEVFSLDKELQEVLSLQEDLLRALGARPDG